MAVQKEYFTVLNYKEMLFNDCGDRVAQLLHGEFSFPLSQCQNKDIGQEILIVNTHLLFPHDSSLCLIRLHQVCKHLILALKHNLFLCLVANLDINFAFFEGLQNTSVCGILSERVPT